MNKAAVTSGAESRGVNRPFWQHAAALWPGFVLTHLILIWLCLNAPGWPLGDVEQVYYSWAEGAASGAFRVGIDTPFVYPILAFVPIFAALSLGPELYVLSWLGIVTLLNAAAFAVLIHGRPQRLRRALLGWWWLAFLVLLGPIALGRIDSVTVPLAIMGLLWLRTRPLWGAALLTIATWVKVWPVAALLALLVTVRRRTGLLAVILGVSAVIVGVALALGSGLTVFSFITEQTGRGIQIEAPVAGFWLWAAALGTPGAGLYYDQQILTYQIVGAATEAVSAVMTPVLAVSVAAIAFLGWRRSRAGAPWEQVFPLLLLALTLTLITINKVGSPQFISWLAAPIIFGLLLQGRAWRMPAVLGLVLAALTQFIYPSLYGWLLAVDPLMLMVLASRNALEFVLLLWAVRALWRLQPQDSGESFIPAPHSAEPGQPE